MRTVLSRAILFAGTAFLLVLVIDALLSLVFQPPPSIEFRTAFYRAHGVFHGAVLTLSAAGAVVGFLVVRKYLPPRRTSVVLALAYGLVTVIAGPGAFLLSGALGAATWLLLGSMAFSVGAAVFANPWRASREAWAVVRAACRLTLPSSGRPRAGRATLVCYFPLRAASPRPPLMSNVRPQEIRVGYSG